MSDEGSESVELYGSRDGEMHNNMGRDVGASFEGGWRGIQKSIDQGPG